jgi:AAA15 family ATPase/GTPase
VKIKRIKIENILGIEDMEINTNGVTIIEGRNASGKTSVIEAIKYALKGGADGTLLRNGTDQGEIVLIFDDGTKIEKTIVEGKADTIKLFDHNGHSIKSPASYIKTLYDMLSVNPVEFLNSDKKTRTKILLESLPLELPIELLKDVLSLSCFEEMAFSLSGNPLLVINEIYKTIYEERTVQNRILKEKVATNNQLSETLENIDCDPILINSQIEELEEKRKQNEQKKDSYISKLQQEIKTQLDSAMIEYNKTVEKAKSLYDSISQLAGETFQTLKDEMLQKYEVSNSEKSAELGKLKQQLENAGAVKNQIKIIEDNREVIKDLDKKTELFTEALSIIESAKSIMLKDIPIPGIEVEAGEIFCDGIIFDRLNTAKQIEISVEIAKLRAGDLKLICVDGIERLDSVTLEKMIESIQAKGLQMIGTKVSDNANLVINNN